MKWTSWAFLGFLGSLIFLVVFIKDRKIKTGVDRLSEMNQSAIEADPNLKLVSELRADRTLIHALVGWL
jgi:hypothetical protein